MEWRRSQQNLHKEEKIELAVKVFLKNSKLIWGSIATLKSRNSFVAREILNSLVRLLLQGKGCLDWALRTD